MKQVLLKQGGVTVQDVPAPQAAPGAVLVRTAVSCVSVGTEMSGVKASNLPLWKRALERPDQVRRVAQMFASEGLARTRDAVRQRLAQASPIGYSLAGTVIEVGDGIDDLAVGDRVACAGAQSANHAEVVCVPRNLVVPVPDGLDLADASTVTLGAIALQGVRRAEPTLGESFVVIGLGIIGQVTVQILKANGVRVIGADLDARRIEQALASGMDLALRPEDEAGEAHVARLTGGVGADGVIVTAASSSDAIIATAFRMCRRKGRVVLVGDVGLDIDRADIYAKELDFRISTSYGPGRYDRTYEEAGLDYPIGYVRWTENRNMQAYLDLLAAGRISLRGMLGARYPVDEAPAAYARLQDAAERPLTALLTYPEATADTEPTRRIVGTASRPARAGAVRLALVGAGGFARSSHLPTLRANPEAFSLRSVCSRQGHNAKAVAAEHGAAFATTDYAEVLADAETDAVLITTRHDLHAAMVLKALEAGKHVLVEKPLCLTRDELAAIEAFYADGTEGKPVLLTGFNRRFSPYVRRIGEATAARSNPMIVDYRVNAGYFPPDTWVHGPEGGGRNRGEACHFYDLFVALTGAAPTKVSATSLRPATTHYRADDNFVATVAFDDGSVATLTYTALGNASFPKERFEVFSDGRVYAVDDFTKLETFGGGGPKLRTSPAEKGHREELLAFAHTLQKGGDWPIPLWQQAAATRIALDVEEQLG
ncbi:MAG: bi-domain-containing oxidoreductase [Kiloniellaceae bacterium]